MTTEQAAALIDQNTRLLDLYGQFVPLFQSAVHDVFPLLAVALCAVLGVVLGQAATA